MRKINRVKVNTDSLSFDFFDEPATMSTVDSDEPKLEVRPGLVRGIKQEVIWQEDNYRVIGEIDGLRNMQELVNNKWIETILPVTIALKAFAELYQRRLDA